MLLGREGKWELKPPFTQYSTSGLVGEIRGLSFMKMMVSKGNDVRTDVYLPVGAESQYVNDLSNDQIIVTIRSGGKLYHIPDNYIANLYDGFSILRDHFISVKVGPLPSDHDLSMTCAEIANVASKVSGVDVKPKDVYVSVSNSISMSLTTKEATYEALRVADKVSNNDSVYTKLSNTETELSNLKEEYNSLLSLLT